MFPDSMCCLDGGVSCVPEKKAYRQLLWVGDGRQYADTDQLQLYVHAVFSLLCAYVESSEPLQSPDRETWQRLPTHLEAFQQHLETICKPGTDVTSNMKLFHCLSQ